MAKKDIKDKEEKKRLPVGVSERKNGSLVYQFTVDGKRYSVYGHSLRELKANELKKRKQIEETTEEQKNSKESVKVYADAWLARQKKIKSQTKRTYGKLLNRITNTEIDSSGQTFGSLRMKDVTIEHAEALQAALKTELHSRTVNDIMILCKRLFRDAVNRRVILWSPCEVIESYARAEEEVRNTIHRALTPEETQRFFQVAEVMHSHYLPLYKFLLYTGARVGEAGAVKRQDINKGFVRINKTVIRTEAGYELGEETKTKAGTRGIPLRPETLEAIKDQLVIDELLHDGDSIRIDKPIFRSPTGGLLRSDRINKDIKSICKKAGIEPFTCHCFRHTWTTRIQEGGVQQKEGMAMSGHKDVQMFGGTYSHGNEQAMYEQLMAVNFF